MDRRGVRIVDTFAEAFGMRAARVLITARSTAWARTAAQSMTGFATSVIGCKVEAKELTRVPSFESGLSSYSSFPPRKQEITKVNLQYTACSPRRQRRGKETCA